MRSILFILALTLLPLSASAQLENVSRESNKFLASNFSEMPEASLRDLKKILAAPEFQPRSTNENYFDLAVRKLVDRFRRYWSELKDLLSPFVPSADSFPEIPMTLVFFLNLLWKFVGGLVISLLLFIICVELRKLFFANPKLGSAKTVVEQKRPAKTRVDLFRLFDAEGALVALSELRRFLREDIKILAGNRQKPGTTDRSLSLFYKSEAEEDLASYFQEAIEEYEAAKFAGTVVDAELVKGLLLKYAQLRPDLVKGAQ